MKPDKGWDYNPGKGLMEGVNKAIASRQGKVSDVLLSKLEEIKKMAEMKSQIAPYRQVWPKNFPSVILDAGLGEASKHSQYAAAKSGDLEAASRLVSDLISQDAVNKLITIIGDKKPLLIPVHAEEAISINRIPLAYAVAIGRKLNLPVELNIVQAAKVDRTGSDGFVRLAFPPPFSGKPSQDANFAVVFDDTLTQGGTLANLIGYI
jgi:hypothetical protein